MVKQTKQQLEISNNGILKYLLEYYGLEYIKLNKRIIIEFINQQFKIVNEEENYNINKLNSWIYNRNNKILSPDEITLYKELLPSDENLYYDLINDLKILREFR